MLAQILLGSLAVLVVRPGTASRGEDARGRGAPSDLAGDMSGASSRGGGGAGRDAGGGVLPAVERCRCQGAAAASNAASDRT